MAKIRPLTTNQEAVLKYLQFKKAGEFVSPTKIGQEVGGGNRHSAWASPICKRLVERGLLVRRNDGRYAYADTDTVSQARSSERKQIEKIESGLLSLMKSLSDAFSKEQSETDAFKGMFEAGNTHASLLRHLVDATMADILNASDVLEKRLGGFVSTEAYEFLLAAPYLASKLEKEIERVSGPACCVDKTYHLMAEHLKRISRKK